MKYSVAVDVMTAERGLDVAIAGCIAAKKFQNLEKIVLVGDSWKINKLLGSKNYSGNLIEIVHADTIIDMDEPNPALRVKSEASSAKKSSVVRAAELVLEKRVNAYVSPGNTAAMGASARLILGKIEGIKKTPIASAIPTMDSGKLNVICDVGTNVNVTEKDFAQFAILLSSYIHVHKKTAYPKIGLMNIGTEDQKGSSSYKSANDLLAKLGEKGVINYAGNTEPYSLFDPSIDGLVCDGHIGNFVLKTMEATAKFMKSQVKEKFKKPKNLLLSMPGMLGILSTYYDLKMSIMNPSNYAGAPVLGVKGTAIVTHGSADSDAICAAIGIALDNIETLTSEKYYNLVAEKCKECCRLIESS